MFPLTGSEPMKAYMIYDPQDKKWYRKNMIGFVSWDIQTKGAIWTSKKEANDTLSGMRGSRAERCVVKPFLLIPVDN